MAIGQVQLLVLGFDHPDFHGEVIAELERLKDSDTVRVIDSLAVYKDADGEIEVMHLSNLTRDEAVELGSKVGALIGLGIDGEEGAEVGALAGAEAAAEDSVRRSNEEEAWDVLEDIPSDSAAALILLEHHWAVGLRDAIARAGGFRISDGFISPFDLVGIGLVSAQEAEQLHALERGAESTSTTGDIEMMGSRRVARRTSRRVARPALATVWTGLSRHERRERLTGRRIQQAQRGVEHPNEAASELRGTDYTPSSATQAARCGSVSRKFIVRDGQVRRGAGIGCENSLSLRGACGRDSRVQAEARKAAGLASRSAKRAQRLGAERSLHDNRVSRDLSRAAHHASRAASFAFNGPPETRIRNTSLVIAGAGTIAGVMSSRRSSHATSPPSAGNGDAPASNVTPAETTRP